MAGLYIRVLTAWLIAMQPLLAAYGAAQAASTPLAMELCRGAPAPGDEAPAPQRAHSECCLAAAASPAGPAPASARVAIPAVHTVTPPAPREITLIARTPRGAHSARAPPL